MSYTAYITRNEVEHEVTADLYDHGYGYYDRWEDTGISFEIEKDPKFHNFYSEDDNGVELCLTSDEIEIIVEQMKKQYWDEY